MHDGRATRAQMSAVLKRSDKEVFGVREKIDRSRTKLGGGLREVN